jgi:tetratricopeptide (TPR) repeat protein
MLKLALLQIVEIQRHHSRTQFSHRFDRLRRIVAAASFALCLTPLANAAEFDRIGSFDFPTSATGAAQEHFLLGVGYLHSFGFEQAQAEFRRAQELDPDFAMAYWGEVFTYQHPFFGGPSDGPAQALQRLGRTPEERAAKAPNALEKGFLRAAEAYALGGSDMPAKRTAWMNAMLDVYEQFPDHDEVRAFTTVAMLAGATAAGDDRERINMRAGAIGMELFKKNDDHPGAAHYVIHAFDDPIHAPIALEAAWKYADIAPAVSHARHMPTHIFIQHGMWEQVSLWNDSAFEVAKELWRPGDPADPQNHASDWGQYGDLQLWDLDRSALWIARAEQTLRENPDHGRSRNTLKTMISRHTIETEQWQLQAFSAELTGDELLALGLSAANLGDLALANQVATQLQNLSAASPNNDALKISASEVAGLVLFRESQQEAAAGRSASAAIKQREGLTLLEQAVKQEEAGLLPNGAANPLKPAHELAGEVLLEAGMASEAATQFDISLKRTPNRPRSLLGAARAHLALGHEAVAAAHYRALLANWTDDSLPAVQEAKNFLGY